MQYLCTISALGTPTAKRTNPPGSPEAQIPFDERPRAAYSVRTMPSRAIAKEIPARSSLSGRPVGLLSGFALSLLALLVLLAR
jgi:hypothetical protein